MPRKAKQTSGTTGPLERREVLEVKPLRSLSPLLPAPLRLNTSTIPDASSLVYINRNGSYPLPGSPSGHPWSSTIFPFASQHPPKHASEVTGSANGDVPGSANGEAIRRGKSQLPATHKPKKKVKPNQSKKITDEEIMLQSSSHDPRESVEVVLMTFDAIRRRLLQADERNEKTKRPDLKASAILTSHDLRANMGKRVGAIPGVEIGDIFYFRIELCLVGLHAPSMAGIDYMNVKFDQDDTVAISVVSSGGYENEENDVDMLIYTGSGGSGKYDGKEVADDQKLERGNLALERSLHRANLIRVIRSAKDANVPTGKIYIYDGLYKIYESWVEKGKLGFNIFKYKLLREPGQSDGFATWKMTQKWKDCPSSRERLIIPDISLGVEKLPVCLVNDVDSEKVPVFQYVTSLTNRRPFMLTNPDRSCLCLSVCLPGDKSCSCARENGGNFPYSSSGLLVNRKPMLYECSASCLCCVDCRNRVSQRGVRLQFEVFRTVDRGWGLRSWDPIRAGTFICEYTGEVVDIIGNIADHEVNDYIFRSNPVGEKTSKWSYGTELLGEPSVDSENDASKPLNIVINAKNMGNVSRFMNHSCSPNVFWQPIQHDHSDEGSPHIMFFALSHIPPMTELTYDYGSSGGDAESDGLKKCLCGSRNCRGVLG